MQIDFVTHEEILIECLAERVWPYILQPNLWKSGTKLEHAYGPAGMRGEGFAAVTQGSSEALFYVQNVELKPFERRTIKLLQSREGALFGYASWGLRETSGITRLTYDVYAQFPQSDEGTGPLTADEREALEKQYIETQGIRFREELQHLKVLVEGDEGRALHSPQSARD